MPDITSTINSVHMLPSYSGVTLLISLFQVHSKFQITQFHFTVLTVLPTLQYFETHVKPYTLHCLLFSYIKAL